MQSMVLPEVNKVDQIMYFITMTLFCNYFAEYRSEKLTFEQDLGFHILQVGHRLYNGEI